MPETTEFTLKKSKRAKHIRLTISSTGQLVIVVPYTFNLDYLPTILERKKSWIEKSLRDFRQQDREALSGRTIPETIELKAIDTVIRVEIAETADPFLSYLETQNRLFPLTAKPQDSSSSPHGRPATGHKIKVKELPDNILLITASDTASEEILAKINSWLAAKARHILVPWLLALADERGIDVKSVSIRSQQTRWGSCSTSGRISLNKTLLFLPPVLVNHIMLHELCHLKEMNHSLPEVLYCDVLLGIIFSFPDTSLPFFTDFAIAGNKKS